jgi:hypothetical protein
MNWFSKGKEVVQQNVDVAEEIKKNRAPYRVWIKPNAEITVIYLDDEGFTFQEHAVQNGDRWEQYSCLGSNNGCPLCASGNRAYSITLFSIIDCSRWVSTKGEVHENEKKIHAVKSHSALTLLNKKERWGGLVGKKVILSRKGEKDSAAGSDFEPVMKDGKILKYKLSDDPKWKPFDYVAIYAPKSVEFIKTALGITTPTRQSNAVQKTTTGSSAAAFQTVPDGIEEIESEEIPSNVDDSDVPF